MITPVYNVPVEMLRACLESLCAQTLRECEFVVVSDGAPDEVRAICRDYAENDSRFRFFEREHGGVSAARNFGIGEAKGDYLAFVDADDCVEPEMLEKCLAFATSSNANLVMMDLFVSRGGIDEYRVQMPDSLDPESILRQILRGELFGGMQIRIIEADFYGKNPVKWREDLGYCEDVAFWAEFLRLRPMVAYMGAAFYHYVQGNPNSITTNYTAKTFKERQKFIGVLKEILPTSFSEEVKTAAFNVKLEAMRHGLLSAKDFISFERTPLRIIWRSRLPRRERLRLCAHTVLLALFGRTCREYL